MNRRDFIKTGSIGLASLSTGVGMGSILLNDNKDDKIFSTYAFLPDDNKIILDCLKIFQHKIKSRIFSYYLNNNQLNEIINKRFYVEKDFFFTKSFVDVKLICINDNINGDIYVNNKSNLVLDPNRDFDKKLFVFREKINSKKSKYLLSIELNERNLLSDIINPKNKIIEITNNKGLFEKISLMKNYSLVNIPGSIGNTEIKIENGKVFVINSPCRHKLCKNMSHISGNKTIACVPNKILIKII
ncbi:MAG: NusG domain II-containing protein [Bacteroidetes bacterium]|nr:NusG domain II-containing protein [Bacteroidota bacterium]